MSQTSSLLLQLRTACHTLHEALHVHPLLAPLNGGKLTLSQYKKVLQAFYCSYAPLEEYRFETSLPCAPVLAWLEADFDKHNIAKPQIGNAPFFITDISSYAGYLYVKQGSTLGGQLISKYLYKSLGLEPGIDNHFFYGYGTETGRQWKLFQQNLAEVEPRLKAEKAIQAAIQTFESIRNCCDAVLQAENEATATAY